MKPEQQNLAGKYDELKEMHNKVLHELADAAQIIKSYEYLEQRYKKENELLEKILTNADELCNVRSLDSLQEKRTNLIRAIQQYRTVKSNGKLRPAPPTILSQTSNRDFIG